MTSSLPGLAALPRMQFYLGTHNPAWLFSVAIPWMVSRRRLVTYKRLRTAVAPWVLDSGGFSELVLYGEWRTTPEQYVSEVRRYADEIGRLEWAAIQDWMCEPFMLKKTGLTLQEHQQRTVQSYLTLNELDDSLPWLPVLQGQTIFDYLTHVTMYDQAGIDLTRLPVVGLGSVCRRQATKEVHTIAGHLRSLGLQLHGFGVKTAGLDGLRHLLVSSDSLAWSFDARYSEPLPGHTHRNCANCLDYALAWRERIMGMLRC